MEDANSRWGDASTRVPPCNLSTGYNGYLPPVTVTSDVIGQFYVRLFFGVELVLVMIRVGAKFRL